MSAPTVLKVEGELTIFRAAELKPLFLETPELTEMDLSAVTELDTAGLQLLMLAKRTALAQGRELQFTGHSPAVLDVLALLNVAADLGDQTMTDSPAAAPGTRS